MYPLLPNIPTNLNFQQGRRNLCRLGRSQPNQTGRLEIITQIRMLEHLKQMQRRVPLEVLDLSQTRIPKIVLQLRYPDIPRNQWNPKFFGNRLEVGSPWDRLRVDEVQRRMRAVSHLGYCFSGVVEWEPGDRTGLSERISTRRTSENQREGE